MEKYQQITNPLIDGNIKFKDDSKIYTAKSSISGTITLVFPKDYLIELSSPFDYTIEKIFFKLNQGNCTLNLIVNGVYILNNIVVSSILLEQDVNINITKSDTITIEVISINNAFDLNYSFHTIQNE